MIKPHELNCEMRGWLAALSEDEQASVLDLATDVMLAMERKNGRARLGENGSVELVMRTILFYNERGTDHE
jgi:hypothetical protein